MTYENTAGESQNQEALNTGTARPACPGLRGARPRLPPPGPHGKSISLETAGLSWDTDGTTDHHPRLETERLRVLSASICL